VTGSEVLYGEFMVCFSRTLINMPRSGNATQIEIICNNLYILLLVFSVRDAQKRMPNIYILKNNLQILTNSNLNKKNYLLY